MTRRVAVVGSGVAGLTAAYVASRTAHVTLFEADTRLGGHADTHEVPSSDGVGHVAVDTGFIVHNERTYPTLLRLFAELGVRTQDSEMSMSVRDPAAGLEYAGALGPRGLFPTAANLRRPAYLRMLAEVPRFHRTARALLADGAGTDGAGTAGTAEEEGGTVRDFLARHGFSAYFARHFAEPLIAAVWSCDPAVALDYPARYLFAFLEHHGMLGVLGSPRWRTVTGGSREYVRRVAEELPNVRVGTKVTRLVEDAAGVELTDGEGAVHRFDAVVVATHPDQALAMLADPTPAQRELLGAIGYSQNVAQLHTDTSVLPRAPRARASWNFLRRDDGARGVTVTYDLTRLMRLPVDAHGTRYLVTLGGADLVDPSRVLATREYAHPLYTPASVAARARLSECDTDRVAFAGAYHGWGFHEDGARAGLAAATHLGLDWPEPDARPVAAPGLYATTIRHTRRRPRRRAFEHRSHTWLVDLDTVPDHGVLCTFEARDHLGDPDRSIRENVDRFLAARGVPRAHRVLMAAQPRALGHCFNPISVFWCLDESERVLAVVVEVHNTYGDRHAYLLHPDGQGRARAPKEMYVSPFHGTDGHYEVAVPLPRAGGPRDRTADRLEVAVTLRPGPSGDATFSSSMSGRRVHAATRGDVARAALAPWRGTALIHAHGVWLWARGLPVRPRPDHPPQEGVA